jgi:tetratricopeptide (TPR) repeat protein
LIDANGEHLWAESYDRSWQSILTVHDEIIYSIVEAIEPELILSETERSRHVGTGDLVAWDYYLQARALSGEEFSPTTLSGKAVSMETNEEAWRLANKALETAPDFAALYSLMSHIDGVAVFVLGHQLPASELSMRIERGLENAARARTLDPFEATACACQIMLLLAKGDVAAAVQVGESALQENPGSSFILAGMAKALQINGNYERALALILKAKRLSPRGISMPTYLLFEATIRQSMGDFAGAIMAAQQAKLLARSWPSPAMVKITSLLAAGDRAAAVKALNKWQLEQPGANPVAGTWPGPFPPALIDGMPEPLRHQLEGKSYAEGIMLVVRELGWHPTVGSI